MKIYVIRHGVTEWNKLRKIQGSVDIPLAKDGIDLAIHTGEALKEVPFDICFTSPLSRAKETAKYVIRDRNIPIIEDLRIKEINFGILEGTVYVKGRDEESNPQMDAFFNHPIDFGVPKNGEGLKEVLARTKDFWEDIISREELKDKTILISTHGCATRALLQNLYQTPEDFWHGCVPPNCAVNIIEVENGVGRFIEEDKVY